MSTARCVTSNSIYAADKVFEELRRLRAAPYASAMEATLCFTPLPFTPKRFGIRAQSCFPPPCAKPKHSVLNKFSIAESRRTNLLLLNGTSPSPRANRRFSVHASDKLRSHYLGPESVSDSRAVPFAPGNGAGVPDLSDGNRLNALQPRSKMYRNRFLDFVRISSVVNNAAEWFFRSEIRRRLFVTAVLIVISRVGYYIPLPGFDRRLIPRDYLSFVSGSVDELGDFTAGLKLSFFQLGISPQILASIFMQVLCHVVPSLVKLRKEGLDGHEKIKSYIWWISLGFATMESVTVAFYSLPYSIYAASYRAKHVMLTTLLLVCGAMTMTWICDTISESGFGQGSSLIICVGILTGYTETLYKMLSQLSGSAVSWWLYMIAVLGIFTIVTMGAVVVTEGCRKIKLQYYGFKLASAARSDSPITEVEPYIPFNINPSGMQPLLTTTYLLAIPSILAGLLGSPFWAHVKDVLNPETSIGAGPWVYYTSYAFFVFLFNIFDIANLPKEIADYLNKMGARIPNIKPGKATIEYLTKIQASTRFWGGLLLSILATSSSIFDHYLRSINEGFSIGFTSVLIIVGSIIELRRSYQAYNVMPGLSKALKRYGV
ncbi:Preprotein translocase subunit scy2, chloroplastic [Turnera subulata]|uniref:Preprotein translocase subunit scy2, chloroplastic n=1 Tax=Turnera subulata TaxID=218843 RepID=A0A9Q0G4V2_9ROSI|nr:Preprotein translocase subunit scy2, chloroplastic [Turnera subulata]